MSKSTTGAATHVEEGAISEEDKKINETFAEVTNLIKGTGFSYIKLKNSMSYLKREISFKKINEISATFEISSKLYTFNDKFAPYYQVKYYHSSSFDDFNSKGEDTKNDDYFEHYIGLTYTHNAHASATLELGSELFHARDGKNFLSKKASYPEAAIYLDFSI